MACCNQGCDPSRTDLWGLLFFTSQAVYFRHFPQHSFLRNLVRSGRIGDKSQDTPLFVRIEYITLRSVEVVRDDRFSKRLFGQNRYKLVITHTAAEAATAGAAAHPAGGLSAMPGVEPAPSAAGASEVIHISVDQHAPEVLDFLRHNDAFSGILTERRGRL